MLKADIMYNMSKHLLETRKKLLLDLKNLNGKNNDTKNIGSAATTTNIKEKIEQTRENEIRLLKHVFKLYI